MQKFCPKTEQTQVVLWLTTVAFVIDSQNKQTEIEVPSVDGVTFQNCLDFWLKSLLD